MQMSEWTTPACL